MKTPLRLLSILLGCCFCVSVQASASQVFWAGTYKGTSNRGDIQVSVSNVKHPVVLVLTAYKANTWNIGGSIDKLSLIEKIIVSGYEPQVVKGVDPAIVEYKTYQGEKDPDFFYSYEENDNKYKRGLKVILPLAKTSVVNGDFSYSMYDSIVETKDHEEVTIDKQYFTVRRINSKVSGTPTSGRQTTKLVEFEVKNPNASSIYLNNLLLTLDTDANLEGRSIWIQEGSAREKPTIKNNQAKLTPNISINPGERKTFTIIMKAEAKNMGGTYLQAAVTSLGSLEDLTGQVLAVGEGVPFSGTRYQIKEDATLDQLSKDYEAYAQKTKDIVYEKKIEKTDNVVIAPAKEMHLPHNAGDQKSYRVTPLTSFLVMNGTDKKLSLDTLWLQTTASALPKESNMMLYRGKYLTKKTDRITSGFIKFNKDFDSLIYVEPQTQSLMTVALEHLVDQSVPEISFVLTHAAGRLGDRAVKIQIEGEVASAMSVAGETTTVTAPKSETPKKAFNINQFESSVGAAGTTQTIKKSKTSAKSLSLHQRLLQKKNSGVTSKSY